LFSVGTRFAAFPISFRQDERPIAVACSQRYILASVERPKQVQWRRLEAASLSALSWFSAIHDLARLAPCRSGV